MDGFTIFCTPDQTRKALKLGAPITIFSDTGNIPDDTAKRWSLCILGSKTYLIPTAEQMIGFLEHQGLLISVHYGYTVWDKWAYDIDGENYIDCNSEEYTNRQEATIAAIDAALEYLTNKK